MHNLPQIGAFGKMHQDQGVVNTAMPLIKNFAKSWHVCYTSQHMSNVNFPSASAYSTRDQECKQGGRKQMKHRSLKRAWPLRAYLMGLVLALLIFALSLAGCKSNAPTPTPTRTPGIVIVTASPLPPTSTATAVPPTVPQATPAPPTAPSEGTSEPYPPPPEPTNTPQPYPSS